MKNIWMIMTLPLLMLSACSNDTDAVTEEITLTTPVIELGEVSASASRAASTMSKARLTVALYNNDNRVYNENRAATYTLNGGSWGTEGSLLTVTGGEGNYRAGLSGTVSINGTPAIADAFYAYRGSIGVQTNGNFTPDAALSAYSAAVLVNLKDANGTSITSGSYRINPVGLAKMAGFAGGADAFPHGTGEAVYSAADHPAYLWSTTTAQGDFCPSTYPATWTNGELQAGAQTEWPIFEVTYSSAGFNDDGTPVDGGIVTTWDVNYTGEITLDKGKLYSFTITLGLAKATITLDTPNGKPGWGPNVQEHEFDNSPNDQFKAAMNELKFEKETNSVGTFEVSGPNGLMVLNKWMTGSITFDKFKSLNFEGATNFTDSYSRLKQNIKLMVNITLPVVDEGESNWMPIGVDIQNRYYGTFDGNNHTITNLSIKSSKSTQQNSGADYIGLIGCLGEGGKVQNIILESANLSGKKFVGGILGYNYGGLIESSIVNGNISGNSHVGGIVGENENGTLENCTNSAQVIGKEYVGGIAGKNGFSIKCSTNNGTVKANPGTSSSNEFHIGGIVGCLYKNVGKVEGCMNEGIVTGGNNYNVGGIIGYLHDGCCYASANKANVSVGNYVGGIIGKTKYKNIYGCWTYKSSESGSHSDGIGYYDPNDYDFKTNNCYSSNSTSTINGYVETMNTVLSSKSVWRWKAGSSSDSWPSLIVVTESSAGLNNFGFGGNLTPSEK